MGITVKYFRLMLYTLLFALKTFLFEFNHEFTTSQKRRKIPKQASLLFLFSQTKNSLLFAQHPSNKTYLSVPYFTPKSVFGKDIPLKKLCNQRVYTFMVTINLYAVGS